MKSVLLDWIGSPLIFIQFGAIKIYLTLLFKCLIILTGFTEIKIIKPPKLEFGSRAWLQDVL